MDKSSPPKSLELSIIRTLALGDVVDVALTQHEIYQQLGEDAATASLRDVVTTLEVLVEKKSIVTHRGRYALLGRGVLFAERARRYRASVSKWHRARLFLAMLSSLPGVLSVGFYNALGYGNARIGSDIDVVVIAQPGMIGRVRLMAVLLAELVGHRPKIGRIRDALCLSFFFTPQADLSKVKHAEDPFMVWWLTHMHIVSDAHDAYVTWQARNTWIALERPHHEVSRATYFLSEPLQRVFRVIMTIVAWPLFLVSDAWIQLLSRRFGSRTLAHAARAPGSAVVMHDDLLKLHLTDRRREHAKEFARRYARTLKHFSSL